MGLEDFEWDPENVPLVKLGLHIAQVVFAFVVFCLEISVFRDDKAIINGNNAWPFAVVSWSPDIPSTLPIPVYTSSESDI